MGAAKSQKQKDKKSEFTHKGFFSVHLNALQRKEIEALSVNDGQVLAELENAVCQGLKVSFSEANGGGVQCTVYANRTNTDDDGLGFSAYAGELVMAAFVAMYKLNVVIGDMSFSEFEQRNPTATREEFG